MLEYGPEGTMHYVQGTIKGDTGNLYTTGMKEKQIIFGDTSILEQAIRDIDSRRRPGILFVVSSPVSEIIGTDLNMLCRKIQPSVHARLISWDQVPMEGTDSIGCRAAYEKAAAFLCQVPPTPAPEGKQGFLVLGLTEADWNGIAELSEIRRMMKTFFDIPCLNDRDGHFCLHDLANAAWILCAVPDAIPLARAAQQIWNTPWYSGFPLGICGCARMMEAFEAATGIPRNRAWNTELAEASKAISSFRQSLRSLPGRRFYVDAEPGKQSAWLEFLSKELDCVTVFPSPETSALSTDGSVGYNSQIQKGDILIACGMLGSLYPGHASLCIAHPVTTQKQFSAHIPHVGFRGVQNLLTALYELLQKDRACFTMP